MRVCLMPPGISATMPEVRSWRKEQYLVPIAEALQPVPFGHTLSGDQAIRIFSLDLWRVAEKKSLKGWGMVPILLIFLILTTSLMPIFLPPTIYPSRKRLLVKPYFISQGEPVNLWDWIDELFAAMDIDRVRSSLSFPAAYRLGGILEAVIQTYRIEKRAENDAFSC